MPDNGYFINDGVVIGDHLDDALIQKIGTATLQTVAQDLSGAVNEINASLVNYVDYTVTTTSNSGVSPFNAYGEYILPNSVDITKVVSATIYSSISYSNPACVAINNNTRELRVWSKSAASITIRVGIKN